MGSSGVNVITTGSGNDVIDGGGGADIINSGAGNDTVSYYGTESLIDGGGGINTLLLRAVTTVNLANVDQTTGDATSVAGFQNVDASGLSLSVSITGSSTANTITTGSGNDTIDGAGGADIISAGAGDDTSGDVVDTQVKLFVAVAPPLSVTLTLTLDDVPAVVGLPEITPVVGLIDRPAGAPVRV